MSRKMQGRADNLIACGVQGDRSRFPRKARTPKRQMRMELYGLLERGRFS